jgi:hypothetical protein
MSRFDFNEKRMLYLLLGTKAVQLIGVPVSKPKYTLFQHYFIASTTKRLLSNASVLLGSIART